MFDYTDDNYIFVNQKKWKIIRDVLQESKVMVEWLNSNSVQANPNKI